MKLVQQNQSKKMSNSSTLPPQLAQEMLLFLTTGGFTVPQRKALSFLMRFSGVASLVSASFLIHMMLRKLRNKSSDSPTFHRFLLCLSICDVLFETWLAIGVMAVPRSPIAGGYGAMGTRGTCSAQGFFLTLSLGSFIYNAGLSIYYILVIRYGTTEKTVAKYLEPMFHLLALTLPLTFGVCGLTTKVYNPPVFVPPEVGCFSFPYPPNCALTGNHTCERGRHSARWIRAYFSSTIFFLGIVVIMSAWLYWTVRTQYRTSNQYASQETEQMQQRVRAVACQAFLFAFTSVYASGFWCYISILFAGRFHSSHLLSEVVLFNRVIGSSSQGFFNFVIYTRPRYNRLRRRRPEVGRWGALMIVICGERTGNDNRRRSSSATLKWIFTFQRSTAQPSSQTVMVRRRSSWMSSSMLSPVTIEGTNTPYRSRWQTLTNVMFGEDRDSLRNSLVVLFRHRLLTNNIRGQLDLSDATMADSGSQQPKGTNQRSQISDFGTSVAQSNNNELATTSTRGDTYVEEKLGDGTTENESQYDDAVRASHDNGVDEPISADDSMTLPPDGL